MNKGICFHFGYVYKSKKQQVKEIKAAGLNCVMDTADSKFKFQNGGFAKRIKLFKKFGLQLSSLHSKYVRDELPYFWKEGKVGNKIEKNLIKDVITAYKYGFTCVVVHLKGEASQIGFCRLRRILNVCEKLNMPLALENLSNNSKLLENTFANVKSEYLKFCWDVGHNHCFTPNIDFMSLYSDKLIALHLHDNLGYGVSDEQYKKIGYTHNFPIQEGRNFNPDMHTLNKYGTIDWQQVAQKLAKINRPLNLDFEVLMCYRKKETPQQVLAEVYKQACKLEKLIEKYKKQQRGELNATNNNRH